MIEVEHVSKKFGSFTVLDDISFQARRGEIYGLIGYNGVGKTTLMKIISGIYRPEGGCVRFDGTPVYENAGQKKRCFFMTEEATWFPQASLNQMRKFYRGYYEHWSDRTFYGLIHLFGVDPDMKISRFSKGMQRQASLALAFATHSECLLLDEAFDGLDFTMRRTIKEMLKFYAKEFQALLLVSSHNLKELEDLADNIGMLNEGKLIFDDSTKYMREHFSTCYFEGDPDAMNLEKLQVNLLEKEGDGYRCVMEMSAEEADIRLQRAGAEKVHARPVELEEFFRMERKEKNVEWTKIFGTRTEKETVGKDT